jgi:transcription initiation factor TFIID subunit TAF12
MQASDLECYLERTWHIALPGFSSRCVTAAPKIVAESADMRNKASVRSYLAQLAVQQGPGDGEKNDDGGAPAGGS